MTSRSHLIATLLSKPAEIHALVLGIHCGLEGRGDVVLDLALEERPATSRAEQDIAAQSWYASAGVLLGRLLTRLDT